MWRIAVLVAAMHTVPTPAASAATNLGWPETIEQLAEARSKAETCAETLNSSSDKAAIKNGRLTYGLAKSAAHGVISGLTIALVQGGKPETLSTVQTSLKKAGAGLQEVCDAALKTVSASGGTKGVVEDILKAPVEPIINAISAGVSALWARKVETDKLEVETIKTQLEAAEWPDFGGVAPPQ
jgi:hypothetical protein